MDHLRLGGDAMQHVFEHAVVGIALVDAEGRYLRVNAEFCRITGYDEAALQGLTLAGTLDADAVVTRLTQTADVAGGDARHTEELQFLRGDGRVAWTRVTRSRVAGAQGEPTLLVQVEDLQWARHAEGVARSRAERQVALGSLGRQALRGVDLEALLDEAAAAVAGALRVRSAQISPAAGGGGGGHPGGRPGRTPDLSVPIAVEGETFATIDLRAAGPRTFSLEELQFLHEIADVVAAAVTRKREEDRVRYDANHDPLTGLANRALLVDRLHVALARTRRHGGRVAVLFADLDRFKVVNDSLGHAAGDLLLTDVADRLRSTMRTEDTIARIGGDEFVVVCGDLAGVEEAQLVAGRVGAALGEPYLVGDQEVYAPPSIGIALAPGPNADPEDLIADADLAMYHAKAQGRGRWALFTAALRGDSERIELEAGLRHAIERGELRLEYQPVIDLTSGGIVGAEGLVRWQHPSRGLIPPSDFIPLAEETGLIVPLGQWVVLEACRQAARWRSLAATLGRPFVMSVNVSARQMGGHFVDDVLAALDGAGLDAASLALELTETFLMEDAHAAFSLLGELRRRGVHISVDDFGTGYSSLAYLKRLPIDAVKIDRSFIRGLGPDPEDSAIVAAVVSLARTIGLRVIAEGVEDGGQLQRLRELGCQEGQGFLMSRPQPAAAFEAILLSDQRW